MSQVMSQVNGFLFFIVVTTSNKSASQTKTAFSISWILSNLRSATWTDTSLRNVLSRSQLEHSSIIPVSCFSKSVYKSVVESPEVFC